MNRERITALRISNPEGARVKLLRCNDMYSTLQPGTKGTVLMVDDGGTVHVQWDTGEKLGLIEGEDDWVVLL